MEKQTMAKVTPLEEMTAEQLETLAQQLHEKNKTQRLHFQEKALLIAAKMLYNEMTGRDIDFQ